MGAALAEQTHVCKHTLLSKAQTQTHALPFFSMDQGTIPDSVVCKDQFSFGQNFTLLPLPWPPTAHLPLHSMKSHPSSFHCPPSSETEALSTGRSSTPDPSQEPRPKHMPPHPTKQRHYKNHVKPGSAIGETHSGSPC